MSLREFQYVTPTTQSQQSAALLLLASLPAAQTARFIWDFRPGIAKVKFATLMWN